MLQIPWLRNYWLTYFPNKSWWFFLPLSFACQFSGLSRENQKYLEIKGKTQRKLTNDWRRRRTKHLSLSLFLSLSLSPPHTRTHFLSHSSLHAPFGARDEYFSLLRECDLHLLLRFITALFFKDFLFFFSGISSRVRSLHCLSYSLFLMCFSWPLLAGSAQTYQFLGKVVNTHFLLYFLSLVQRIKERFCFLSVPIKRCTAGANTKYEILNFNFELNIALRD